eukprot:Gb_30048 [translate_table: standard]
MIGGLGRFIRTDHQRNERQPQHQNKRNIITQNRNAEFPKPTTTSLCTPYDYLRIAKNPISRSFPKMLGAAMPARYIPLSNVPTTATYRSSAMLIFNKERMAIGECGQIIVYFDYQGQYIDAGSSVLPGHSPAPEGTSVC